MGKTMGRPTPPKIRPPHSLENLELIREFNENHPVGSFIKLHDYNDELDVKFGYVTGPARIVDSQSFDFGELGEKIYLEVVMFPYRRVHAHLRTLSQSTDPFILNYVGNEVESCTEEDFLDYMKRYHQSLITSYKKTIKDSRQGIKNQKKQLSTLDTDVREFFEKARDEIHDQIIRDLAKN